jgi:hypothetical protein
MGSWLRTTKISEQHYCDDVVGLAQLAVPLFVAPKRTLLVPCPMILLPMDKLVYKNELVKEKL